MGALAVAMRAIGEDVSYDYLMGVSGAAFRLHIASPHWYTAPPRTGGWSGFNHHEIAIKALGYDADWLYCDRSKPAELRKTQQAIVHSISQGRPVVAMDLGRHWGVIAGHEDGAEVLLCRTYLDETGDYSRTDRFPRLIAAIGQKKQAPSRREALLRSLSLAVELANTKRVPLGERHDACGFVAYEKWIARLLDDARFDALEERFGAFDEDELKQFLPKSKISPGLWCYYLADAREAAVRYLRSVQEDLTGPGATHLSKAADLYEQIAAKFREGHKNAPYRHQLVWPKPMRHAQAAILKEALALERQAIAEIEKALAAEGVEIPAVRAAASPGADKENRTMKPEQKHQQVVLEDVVKLFDVVWDESKQYSEPRSYIHTQLVCMRAAGWKDVDYPTAMTVSGFGPSFAYHPKVLAHYGAPQGCDERIADATGWGFRWTQTKTVDEAWGLIKKTLDAGKPVRTPWLEEMIFVGYQDATKKADRKVLALCIPFAHPAQWWTWEQLQEWHESDCSGHGLLSWHTQRVRKLPVKESAAQVMKMMVQFARNDPRANDDWSKGVKWGLEGIEAYAADIADMSKSGKKDVYFQAGWLGCHNIYPQVSGRLAAPAYLQRVAGEFPDKVRAHILAAAAEYEAAGKAWREWETHLGRPAPEGAWDDPDHRRAGAAAVRQAAEHEKAAVSKIKKALAEAGQEGPKP